jgi:hypothetical protein
MKRQITTAPAKGQPAANYPTTGMKYFAVIYCFDGTVHLWPGDTKDDCKKKVDELLNHEKIKPRIRAYNIIKRNLDNYQNGLFL